MTIRIANYWAEHGSTRWNKAEPTDEFILEMKNIGFNRILFTEIRYGKSMQDLIAAQSGTLPNIKNVVDKCHALGLTVCFKLACQRFGYHTDATDENAGSLNKGDFFRDDANGLYYRNLMLNAVTYLNSIGIDQIDMEEPFVSISFKTIQDQFFRDVKSRLTNGAKMSFNFPTIVEAKLIAVGFPFNLDAEGTFDLIMTSPNPDTTGFVTNQNMLATRNGWIGYMPSSTIIDGIFISASVQGVTKFNINAIENIKQAVNDGIGVAVWPTLNMSTTQKTEITSVFATDSCPKPQFIFNINQV